MSAKSAIISGIVGLLVGGLAAAGVVVWMNDSGEESLGSMETAPTSEEESGSPVVYDIDDFSIDLIVKSKECHGSGCVVGVDSELTIHAGLPTSDNVWDITYEITGGEDGPIIETITLTKDGYTGGQDVNFITPSRDTKPKAKITRVIQGY